MDFYEEPLMSIIKNIFSSAEKMAIGAITGLASLYAPVYVPIICISVLTIMDALYGYKVSRKYNQKKIESRKAWKTGWKIRDIVVIICGAFTIDQFIVTSLNLHAVEFVAGVIALIEFWSIIESLCELHPKWKIWKVLKKVVKAKGEKYLDVNLDDLSDDNTTTKGS